MQTLLKVTLEVIDTEHLEELLHKDDDGDGVYSFDEQYGYDEFGKKTKSKYWFNVNQFNNIIKLCGYNWDDT